MTSYSSSILVAALLLSSGVCLSEGFSSASSSLAFSSSRSSPPQQQQQQQPHQRQSRLGYAPGSEQNLEADGPKRRRGRPRKNAAAAEVVQKKTPINMSRRRTTTSNTATAATAVDTGAASAKNKARKKSVAALTTVTKSKHEKMENSSAKSSKNSERDIRVKKIRGLESTTSFMLEHELLSLEEEQRLTQQLKRAMKLQESMTTWVGQQQLLQKDTSSTLMQQESEDEEDDDDIAYVDSLYNDLNIGYGDDEENECEYDFLNTKAYGSASTQAMERYLSGPDSSNGEEAEELIYEDGTPIVVDQDVYNVYYGMSDYSIRRQEKREATIAAASNSWIDELFFMDLHDSQQGSNTLRLTDDDIRQALDLPGGRSELRTILLEGALAREKLISSNVRLVASIAKKWLRQPGKGDLGASTSASSVVGVYRMGRPTLDEAIQEGILGLAEAAERFEPDRGYRFSTYATFWVTNSVRKCFQTEMSFGMRLPARYYELKGEYINRIKFYRNVKHGEIPPMEVIADELGVSVKRLRKALELTTPLPSLDASMQGFSERGAGAGSSGGVVEGGTNPSFNFASILASDEPLPEEHVERSLLRQCLENAMATELSPSERDVLRIRIGLDDGIPKTVNEVATVFGGHITPTAIRSMEQRAFRKLRSPYAVHTHKLLAYLDFAELELV